MHVVTAGYPFMDIDAYASATALAELLRLQGESAVAASSAPFNASVPQSLRTPDVQFIRDYKPLPDDIYTIVDLSDPAYFDLNATPEKVVAVIDHHLGFKDFWQEQLGDKAHIELIGAACTLVYELWKEAGLLSNMSQTSAKLLVCGILDNTLNLKAVVTTHRDEAAYAALVKHAGLAETWPEEYFSACQEYIRSNIEEALQNDTKPLDYPGVNNTTIVGQLALWNAGQFIASNKDIIRAVLEAEGLPWYMNLIDIHSNRSIFYSDNATVRLWLSKTLDVTFEGDVATANRMWLRKEIMKQAIERGER